MSFFPNALENLIDQFAALPGVGRKSAQRLAFHVLSLPEEEALKFAAAIVDAKKNIHCCSICQNLTDQETCTICASPKRDQSTICVVAQPRDVLSFERSREYNGVYHVLHGVLSPMNHIGPDDIRIQELVKRVASAFSKAAYRRSSWQPTRLSKEKPPLCTSRGCSNPSGSR